MVISMLLTPVLLFLFQGAWSWLKMLLLMALAFAWGFMKDIAASEKE